MDGVVTISNAEVSELLTFPVAIQAIEHAFEEHGRGAAINEPRSRAVTDAAILAITGPAAIPSLGTMGFKAFSVGPPPRHVAGRAPSAVALYDASNGMLLALV